MRKMVGRSRVGEASLDTVRAVQPLIAGLRRRDRALAEQLVRALTNLAMSAGRVGFAAPRSRRTHVLAAVASASEAAALLRMAVDWRYCSWSRAKLAYEQLNRTSLALWKLARLQTRRPKDALRRAA